MIRPSLLELQFVTTARDGMDQNQLLTLLVSLLAIGTLLIRVGQGLTAVGTARSKNAASAMVRNLIDFALAISVFSFLGIHFLKHGTSAGTISTGRVGIGALTLHFATLTLIASGLIAPAVAERSKWIVPAVGTVLISAVLVPIFGRWVWYGWLGAMGFVDIAGAAPLHLAGALCALVGAWCVGPRMGKYNHDGSTSMIPGHEATMPGIGTLLIIAGWLPAVMGSALLRESSCGASAVAAAGLNALVAAAAGGIGASAILRILNSPFDLSVICHGLLAGAVAMTAGCGMLVPWQAAGLGIVAGLVAPIITQRLDFRAHIDDPGGVSVAHGVGAIVALLGAALFAISDWSGKLRLLGVQALGIVCIGAAALVISAIVFKVLDKLVGLRVKEGDEFDGLDLAQHDVNAYPDFQQTTIKSYHLREA